MSIKKRVLSARSSLRAKRSNLYADMKIKGGYVYIMTNKMKTVLYTGVTSNLEKRIYEHKNKLVDGFTKKYNINKLVYFEVFDSIQDAIAREKQIKGGSRRKKIALIESINPDFKDLSDDF